LTFFVWYGWTALMWASRWGKLEVVNALLLAGADTNHQDKVKSHSYIDIGVVPHES
jgi:ankyrin repeat protein